MPIKKQSKILIVWLELAHLFEHLKPVKIIVQKEEILKKSLKYKNR